MRFLFGAFLTADFFFVDAFVARFVERTGGSEFDERGIVVGNRPAYGQKFGVLNIGRPVGNFGHVDPVDLHKFMHIRCSSAAARSPPKVHQ